MNSLESRPATIGNDAKRESLRAVALPWAILVLVAAIAAISSTFWSGEDTIDLDASGRYLWEQPASDESNAYNPVTGEALQPAAQPVHHHHEHHHVYEEQHKALFPLNAADWWGFGAATIGLILAAGGGIGGGGMLVPIYCLVMGMSPKHAIPLSNISVFGGAVANTIFNIKKRHPVADRPLIDWDLILAMEPQTVAGALIGAILNKLLSEILLTTFLVALLSFTAYTTLKKAVSMYRAETKALVLAGQRADGTMSSELTKLANQAPDDDDDDDEEDEPEEEKRIPEVVKIDPRLQEILKRDRHIPSENVNILVALFVVVLASNVLKGGGAFSPLRITCGSTAFWLANFGILAWITAVSWHARAVLLRKHREKLECGYQFLDSDIKWDETNTIKYPAICALAGYCAGLFGIGGGIVKGPLMLAMNVHPAVSAASSATMILFTSFTATTSFVVFGLLIADYAVACFLLGFVATCVGQEGLNRLMKKAGRNSYIAFSVGIVVLVSAFLMTIQSLLSIAAGETHHSGGICGKGD